MYVCAKEDKVRANAKKLCFPTGFPAGFLINCL